MSDSDDGFVVLRRAKGAWAGTVTAWPESDGRWIMCGTATKRGWGEAWMRADELFMMGQLPRGGRPGKSELTDNERAMVARYLEYLDRGCAKKAAGELAGKDWRTLESWRNLT